MNRTEKRRLFAKYPESDDEGDIVPPWYLSGGISAADCLAAWTPVGKSNLANSYINEANPGTYDLSLGVAPEFSNRWGWNFNAITTNQFLKTGLIPTSQNHSYIIKFSDMYDFLDQVLFGSYVAGKYLILQSRLNTTPKKIQFSNCGTSVFTESPQMREGTIGMRGLSCYRNGVYKGVVTGGTVPTIQSYIGGLNNNPGLISYLQGKISHIAAYNPTITANQLLAVHNKLNGYKGAMETYCDYGLGAMVCFNMSTFGAAEWAPADQPLDTFAPTNYSVSQWLDAIAAAGCKYAMLTTKHHDGFALWPTAFHVAGYSPYSIEGTTWYANNGHPDLVSQFVAGCRTRGIAPCLYFSIWDITWESRTGTDETTNAAGYISMIETQLNELLTNYGDICALWLDGWYWHVSGVQIPYSTIYSYIKSVNPHCLVINNNNQAKPNKLSEIECWESVDVPSGNYPYAEQCLEIRLDSNWFYHPGLSETSGDFMTKANILAKKAQIIGRDASYLIGICPNTTGQLATAQYNLIASLGTP